MNNDPLETLLHEYATTPEPDPHFAQRLEQKLLTQQQTTAPTQETPFPSILASLRARFRPARTALSTIAALTVLAAIAVLFATWFSSLSQSTPLAGPTSAPTTTEPAAINPDIAETTTATSSVLPVLGRLAYVQNGDLWLRALPDGEPQRLTTSGNVDSPRWSPSGRWLAYRQDDILWVLDTEAPEAATSLQTTASGGFAWAPGADKLAFAGELKLFDAASGSITTLVSLPPDGADMHRILHPHWSPDGAAIAYEQLRIATASGDAQQDAAAAAANAHAIWQVVLDGSAPTKLYDSDLSQKGQALLAGWSGDGSHLLFWQAGTPSASLPADGAPLYALPATGGDPQPVAGDGQTVPIILPWPDYVAPAPTGHWLALVTGSGRQTWQNKQLVVTSLDGNQPLTTLAADVALSPTWAPNAGRLAYVHMPPLDAAGGEEIASALLQRTLHVVDFGSEPRALTNDPAYRDEHPLWSATSTHILFARVDAENNASLWLMAAEAEGSEPQMVVESLSPAPRQTGWMGVYGHVDWSRTYDWWPGRSPRSCPGQVESWTVEWTITPGRQIGYASPEEALAAQSQVNQMPGNPLLGLETPNLVIWQLVQNGEETGRITTVRFEDGSWGATDGWHCTPVP